MQIVTKGARALAEKLKGPRGTQAACSERTGIEQSRLYRFGTGQLFPRADEALLLEEDQAIPVAWWETSGLHFITAGDKRVHIGFSPNPERRLVDLKKEEAKLPEPSDLELVAVVTGGNEDDANCVRARLGSLAIKDDWFALSETTQRIVELSKASRDIAEFRTAFSALLS